MDFHGIEALLGLPEFRVIHVVMNAKQLELPLERRDTCIVCPRWQTCCSRVQDSRPRGLRDFPMLDPPGVLWLHLRRLACAACPHRPWEKRETCGEQVQWSTRLSPHVRQDYVHGCPCRALARRYGLSERTGCRWPFERSRGGRPRQLGRAIGIDAYARRKGHRSTTLLVNVDTGKPIAPFQGRRAEEVMAWCQSRPQAERDQVEVGVMEMSKTYASAIHQLVGEQGHVIDRFHVVPLAVEALDGGLRSVKSPGSREREH